MAYTNEQIGDLIMEYRDNLKTIACLSNELHKAGEKMVDIGNSLKDSPSSLKSDDILQLGLREIGCMLTELDAAQSTNDRLEDSLRQAGLEFAIHQPSPPAGQVTVIPKSIYKD